MSKVYLAIPGAPDQLLGHVDEGGRIYRSRTGPDAEIGHVDLASGHVYEQRLGPDKKVGHVELSSGKVYASRLGPDEHVGQVAANGRLHRQQVLAPDDYVGKIEPLLSAAHAAGAMLLLVLPALEAQSAEEAADPDEEEPLE